MVVVGGLSCGLIGYCLLCLSAEGRTAPTDTHTGVWV